MVHTMVLNMVNRHKVRVWLQRRAVCCRFWQPRLAALALALTLSACASLVRPNFQTSIEKLRPGNYVLDPQHTFVIFRVDHLGLSQVIGRFNRVEASLNFDPNSLADLQLDGLIDTSSIDIGNPDFESQLRGRDWLAVDRFPQATFTTKQVTPQTDGKLAIEGELTLLDVTQDISLDARFNGGADNLLTGKYTLGFSAKTAISRKAFGMDGYAALVGDTKAMIILLSPAKTLDADTPSRVKRATQPQFLEQSAELVDTLQTYSPRRLRNLMGISEALANVNAERYQHWQLPFDVHNAKPAVQMFRGDVYVGLDADTLSRADLTEAQKHLRILSGLYGMLKPLDLIQPYRLEMGTALKTSRGRSLYDFWGGDITAAINHELHSLKQPIVVNLASVEYFSAVQSSKLAAPVVSPIFEDEKNGSFKIISFFAKKARGAMARYLITNRCRKLDDLRGFNLDGYRWSKKDSSEGKPVFRRTAKALLKVQEATA